MNHMPFLYHVYDLNRNDEKFMVRWKEWDGWGVVGHMGMGEPDGLCIPIAVFSFSLNDCPTHYGCADSEPGACLNLPQRRIIFHVF